MPSSAEITISEYADCLMIILSLCDLADIEIVNLSQISETNIVQLFIKLHNLTSQITMNLNKELLLEIVSNLVALSNLLEFSDKELEEYCEAKMNKTLKMISEQI
ncbi:hypothetical protein D3C71_1749150 [compost metagenome]